MAAPKRHSKTMALVMIEEMLLRGGGGGREGRPVQANYLAQVREYSGRSTGLPSFVTRRRITCTLAQTSEWRLEGRFTTDAEFDSTARKEGRKEGRRRQAGRQTDRQAHRPPGGQAAESRLDRTISHASSLLLQTTGHFPHFSATVPTQNCAFLIFYFT